MAAIKENKLIMWPGLLWRQVLAHNISPVPNKIYAISKRGDNDRLSYFGFSLILRNKSLIIGAPRDDFALVDDVSIIEPGGIYNCTIPYGNETPKCGRIDLDRQGIYSKHSSNQWLGGSVFGNSKDTGPITVCAPRHSTTLNLNGKAQEIMDGNCYELKFITNLNQWNIEFYSPDKREFSSEHCNRYEYAQMGFSIYKDEINGKTIFGEPGALYWDGRASVYTDSDLEHINLLSISENCTGSWSYLGYSVLTAIFDKNQINSYIVVGAPKYFDTGAVLIFENIQGKTDVKLNLTGLQKYEYFGYSLLVEDLNNDRNNELIVSAPLYTEQGRYDVGAIYVFTMKTDFQFTQTRITPQYSRRSGKRFGTAMTKLGDINHDSFNDIAVSAPFEGNPVVYIYYGSSEGLKENPEQILTSPISNVIPNSMFGLSLNGGVDVDGNGFNDLVIGAPNADRVFLYLTYPVISIAASFENLKNEISLKQIQFNTCIKFFKSSIKNLAFRVIVKSRYPDSRLTFLSKDYTKVTEKYYETIIELNENNCESNFLLIKHDVHNIMKPFEIEMSYEVIQEKFKPEFCKNCVDDYNSKGVIYKKFMGTNECQECIPDLRVKITSTENLKKSGENYYLELGKYNRFFIEYEIKNHERRAYIPKINITTNHKLSFGKIPQFCNEIDFVLQCDLWRNDDLYLRQDDSRKIQVTFGTFNLPDNTLKVIALPYSYNNNNTIRSGDALEFEINFLQSSTVEIVENSQPQIIHLSDEHPKVLDVNKTIKITNLGPSEIDDIQFPVLLPAATNNDDIKLILPQNNTKNFTLVGTYNDAILRTQNNIPRMRNIVKTYITPYMKPRRITIANEVNPSDFIIGRTVVKRSLEENFSSKQFSHKLMIKDTLEDLIEIPLNNSVSITCQDDENSCLKKIVSLDKFIAKQNQSVEISINFALDLEKINEIMEKTGKKYFLYRVDIGVIENKRKWNRHKNILSLSIRTAVHDILIIKEPATKTPVWIYATSFVSGVSMYLLIGLFLYKVGFFKRKRHHGIIESERPFSITDLQSPPPLEKLKEGFYANNFMTDEF